MGDFIAQGRTETLDLRRPVAQEGGGDDQETRPPAVAGGVPRAGLVSGCELDGIILSHAASFFVFIPGCASVSATAPVDLPGNIFNSLSGGFSLCPSVNFPIAVPKTFPFGAPVARSLHIGYVSSPLTASPPGKLPAAAPLPRRRTFRKPRSWTVFPRPMSSARQAPKLREWRSRSQFKPCCW